MDRKQELLKIVGEENEKLFRPMVEKIIFLEKKLEELQQLPFYKTNPKNDKQQKVLPAFKIYKETLQQYNNCIKVIAKMNQNDGEGESCLIDKWLEERMNVNKGKKDMDTG